MKYCDCPHCGKIFEFHGASKDKLGWCVTCPECGGSFDIDIEDYAVPPWLQVQFKNGEYGVVKTYIDHYATEFSDIVYMIEKYVGDGTQITRAKRDEFTIPGTWKKLRYNGYGYERVCHYPRNQDYSNVPCYGCPDRTKCNDDIYKTLAQYEASDLRPEDVLKYRLLDDKLKAKKLTVDDLLQLVDHT